MNPTDTSLGGGPSRFPETTWSLVARLRDGEGPARREGLETLCTRYWRPVYRYLRMTRAKSNDDAKDLVQAFLLWLLEGEAIANYSPERGSFRTYLKVLLDSFSGHQERALRQLKRGGGVKILPLEDELSRLRDEIPAVTAGDPQGAFDRLWLDEVVHHAIERVRARLTSPTGLRQMKVFEAYSLADPDRRPSYAELAATLGIKETDVRNDLFAAREAVREETRAELRQQTDGDPAFEEEWRALFGA